MAERRMFAKSVIDSDAFLDMSVSARLLYFDLGMRADDDGFVTPKKIMRMTGASEDDLKILIAKGFIVPFESGVIVITHWWLNNYIQNDRYHPTLYQEELSQLICDKTRKNPKPYKKKDALDPLCIQDVSNLDTQDRLGKDRLGKDRLIDISVAKNVNQTSECDIEIEKDSTISGTVPVDSKTVNNPKSKDDSTIDYSFYQAEWNEICLSLPKCTLMSDKRRKAVRACLGVFAKEQVLEAMRKVQDSDFLSGRNGAWNGCGFDWLFITGNMTKVLEGNYDNRNRAGHPDMSSSTDYSKYVMEINVDE